MINFINKGGVNTSDATANASDIISPKTAYVDGEKIEGTIVQNGEYRSNNMNYLRLTENTDYYIYDIYEKYKLVLLSGEPCNNSKEFYIGKYDSDGNITIVCTKVFEGTTTYKIINDMKFSKVDNINGYVNIFIDTSYNAKNYFQIIAQFDPATNTIAYYNEFGRSRNGGDNRPSSIIPHPTEDGTFILCTKRYNNGLANALLVKYNASLRTCNEYTQIVVSDKYAYNSGQWNKSGTKFLLLSNFGYNADYYEILGYTLGGTSLSTIKGVTSKTTATNMCWLTDDLLLYGSNIINTSGTVISTISNLTDNKNGCSFNLNNTGSIVIFNNGVCKIANIDITNLTVLSIADTYSYNVWNGAKVGELLKKPSVFQNDLWYWYDDKLVKVYLDGQFVITSLTRNNTTFRDTTDSTGVSGDVLADKTVYNSTGKITGSMPNNGALDYTPSTSQQTIPAGYTSGGTISAVDHTIDSDIQAGNIKSGVEILGVTGSSSVVDTSDANATANDIATGKTAYVDGTKITGTNSGGAINIVNGIVEQYKASTTTINANTFVEFVNDTQISSDLYSYQGVKAIWIDDNKVFLTHMGVSNDIKKLCGVICTISGTDITVGTDVVIAGRNTYFNVDVTMIDIDKVFISHKKSEKLYGVVCEISGTTITPGTDTLISDTANTFEDSKVASIDTDKVFIIHRGANDILSGIVCEISGTTITPGTDTEIPNQTIEYSAGSYLYSDIVSVDTDKVFIIHQYENTTMGGYTLWGTLCTVSGTTITAEPEIEIDRDTSGRGFGYQYSSMALLDTDEIFITYYHYSDNSLRGVVCTISGTTVTFGTAVSLDTIDISEFDLMNQRSGHIVTVSTDIEKVFTIYDVGLNTQNLKAMICTISGTTITPGDSVYLDNVYYSEEGLNAVAIDIDEVFVTHQGSKNSRLDLYGIHYSLMNNNIKAVSTIKESETRVDGVTKTQCTTSTAGDVFVL